MTNDARPLPTWLISLPLGLALAGGVLGIGYMNGSSHRAPVNYVTGSLTLENNSGQTGSVAVETAPVSQDWNIYTEIVDDQRLPVLKEGQSSVFAAFRRRAAPLAPAVAGAPAKPMMGIMVLGLGFNKDASLAALDSLPIETGIALNAEAPYATDVFGGSNGRELWVHVPTQNSQPSIDEGANAVRYRAPAPSNVRMLQTALADLTNYVGIVFSPGSAVATSDDDMDPIMRELGTRGLAYGRLDPVLSLATEQDAVRYKVPVLPPGQSISSPPSPIDVQDHLDETLRLAQENGGALAVITEPNPVVIKTLKQWLSAHAGADFTLVPPSSMASK